jgi:hypothetical protein
MGDDMLAGVDKVEDGATPTDTNFESDIFVPPNPGADPI